MKKKCLVLLSVCCLLLGAAVATQSVANDSVVTRERETESENLRDPEALAELKKATDFLVAQPRFQFKVRIFHDVIQDDGRKLQFEKHSALYLQRPNLMYIDSHHDDGVWRKLWYQGETLSIADLTASRHTQIEAPPTIDATLDMLEDLIKEPQPLADLLYSDLNHLDTYAIEADLVGDSLVDGEPCKHLSFRGETVDWQLWVEQGATPLIRKVAVNYREVPGNPQYVALIDDWETPEHFSEDLFNFVAPQDSQFIKVLNPLPRTTKEGGQQ